MRTLALWALATGSLCPVPARGESWVWVPDTDAATFLDGTAEALSDECGDPEQHRVRGLPRGATHLDDDLLRSRVALRSIVVSEGADDGLLEAPAVAVSLDDVDGRVPWLVETKDAPAASVNGRSRTVCASDGAGSVRWSAGRGWEARDGEGAVRRCVPPGEAPPRLLLTAPDSMAARWLAVVGRSVVGTLDCASWRPMGALQLPERGRLIGATSDWGVVVLDASGAGGWIGAEGRSGGLISTRLPAGEVQKVVLDPWRMGARVAGTAGMFRLEEAVSRLDAGRLSRARRWAETQLESALGSQRVTEPARAMRWPRLGCWWSIDGNDKQGRASKNIADDMFYSSLSHPVGWCVLDGTLDAHPGSFRAEDSWIVQFRNRWWRQWMRWQQLAGRLRWMAGQGEPIHDRDVVDCLEMEARVMAWIASPLPRPLDVEWCPVAGRNP